METHPDFKELLKLFADFRVEYVIVGGYALAFHGAPRYTGDLDVLVSTDAENATRILRALSDFGFGFGFGDSNLSIEDFTQEGRFIRIGHPPLRIDILTSVSGLEWEQVRTNRVIGTYGDVSVFFIGREDFIINERASGRQKELADIEALGE